MGRTNDSEHYNLHEGRIYCRTALVLSNCTRNQALFFPFDHFLSVFDTIWFSSAHLKYHLQDFLILWLTALLTDDQAERPSAMLADWLTGSLRDYVNNLLGEKHRPAIWLTLWLLILHMNKLAECQTDWLTDILTVSLAMVSPSGLQIFI